METVGGTGALLSTLTVTGGDEAIVPAGSLATAVSECEPLVVDVEFHAMLYGLTVSSVPMLTPSSLNCTPEIPRLSVAVADTFTALPETVAPFAGVVIVTTG